MGENQPEDTSIDILFLKHKKLHLKCDMETILAAGLFFEA
jgi:hypothetical protein